MVARCVPFARVFYQEMIAHTPHSYFYGLRGKSDGTADSPDIPGLVEIIEIVEIIERNRVMQNDSARRKNEIFWQDLP